MKLAYARTFWTVLIAFAVTALVPIAFYFGAKFILTGFKTRDNARIVFEEFQRILDSGRAVIHDPNTAVNVADMAYRERAHGGVLDGWNNSMRISAIVHENACTLTVTSAGRDEAFGTADDETFVKEFDLSSRKSTK